MNKIKLLFKRVLPCLLIITCVFTLASCKKNKVSKVYPSVIPVISNGDQAYLTIGNYKVTNTSIYNHLLNSYGLDELYDWIDTIILDKKASEYDSHYNDDEFAINLEQIIYGVDENDSKKSNKDNLTAEEQAETLVKFEKDMRALGYFTEDEYTAYYKREYLKMSFAVNAFKQFVKEYNADEDNEEDYFTTEAIKSQYESLHRPTYDVILVTFDSEKEAKATMQQVGIDLSNLNANWKIDGVEATAASLKQAFEDMYAIYNPGTGASGVKTYTYSELQAVSSTIATKVSNLTVAGTETEELSKSYTHGPASFGSRYYLVLKVNETKDDAKAFEDLSSEEIDEVVHTLVENSLSTSYIDKVLNEERNKISLKIYDQGLETKYVNAYNQAYTDLGIEEFDAYKTTDEESNSVVAEFTYNGTKHTLTADQLFTKLSEKYGSIISLLLIQQYVVLTSYNQVYDIVNNKVLDQEKYDEYYKSDVKEYKTSFENGNYEEKGYPAAYGWENFIRDYLGASSEVDLMTNLDSSLYAAATDAIARSIWTVNKTETDEEGVETTVESDELVQAEIKNMLAAYFSANIIGVYAYYDKDLDGVADAYESGNDTDSLSEQLVNKIYELAEIEVQKASNVNKTFEKAISEIVVSYKLAAPNHSVWGVYKLAGLKVSAISSTSYTNSSSINEDLKAQIKTIWDKISNYDEVTDEEGNVIGAKITGSVLDPGYRYEKNDKAYYLTLKDFTSDVFFISQSGDADKISTAYRISVIKGSAPSYTNSTKKLVDITLEEYDKYISTGTSTKSSAINAFYKGAIANILKVNGVANAKTLNKVLTMTLEQLDTTTFSNTGVADKVKLLIEDSKIVEEDAE